MKPWKIDKDTGILLSASSAPSNFGVTIYNELFQRLGLPFVYLARRAEDAAKLALGIRALDIRGASVSMPLKNQIIAHLDQVASEARSVQSVNTVVNESGKLTGYNTDLDGLRGVLVPLAPREVLIYGSGSVTDSALMVLNGLGAKTYLRARNSVEREKKIARWNAAEHRGEKFELFINATPMSLKGLDPAAVELLSEARPKVFDLVVPQEGNQLLKLCADLKLDYVPGFAMYKHQFVRQFQLYTGVTVDPETVEEIARARALTS